MNDIHARTDLPAVFVDLRLCVNGLERKICYREANQSVDAEMEAL